MRSSSAFKRENRQYLLWGGADGITFIFRPGGLNRTIRPVAIVDDKVWAETAWGWCGGFVFSKRILDYFFFGGGNTQF